MIEKFLIYFILVLIPFVIAFLSAGLVRYVEKKHDGTPMGFIIMSGWIAAVIAAVITISDYM